MRKIKFDELNISSALSIIFQISLEERLINGAELKEKHHSASNGNNSVVGNVSGEEENSSQLHDRGWAFLVYLWRCQ